MLPGLPLTLSMTTKVTLGAHLSWAIKGEAHLGRIPDHVVRDLKAPPTHRNICLPSN